MPKYLNRFTSPKYLEEVIIDDNGDTVGTIRIKPSGVLWKPSGAHRYHRVSLEAFAAWITNPATGATKTKS